MKRKHVLLCALALLALIFFAEQMATWYQPDLSFLHPEFSQYMRGEGSVIEKQIFYAPVPGTVDQFDRQFRQRAGRMKLDDFQQWTQGNGPIYTYRDSAHDQMFEFAVRDDDPSHAIQPNYSYRVRGIETLYARLVMLTYAKRRA